MKKTKKQRQKRKEKHTTQRRRSYPHLLAAAIAAPQSNLRLDPRQYHLHEVAENETRHENGTELVGPGQSTHQDHTHTRAHTHTHTTASQPKKRIITAKGVGGARTNPGGNQGRPCHWVHKFELHPPE